MSRFLVLPPVALPAASLAASLVAAILSLTPMSAAAGGATPPGGVKLTYEVHAGGFIVADSKFHLDLGPNRFEAGVVIRPRGLAALLKEFRLHSQAEGLRNRAGMEPLRYSSEYWKDDRRRRWVEIDYAANAIPRVEAMPPADEDERVEVPEALLVDSLDPMSAALALSEQIERNGRCEGELDVYDGRRLFRLQLSHLGFVEVEAAYKGNEPVPSMKCQLKIAKVTGFEDKERESNRFPDTITLYLTPLAADGLWLPVRLEAKHFLGTLVVRLVSVEEPAGREQRAGRPLRPAMALPVSQRGAEMGVAEMGAAETPGRTAMSESVGTGFPQ